MSGFGAALRELRQRYDLTQYRLAALVGGDDSYVNRLEHGERRPSRAYLAHLNACAPWTDAEGNDLFLAAGYVPEGFYVTGLRRRGT